MVQSEHMPSTALRLGRPAASFARRLKHIVVAAVFCVAPAFAQPHPQGGKLVGTGAQGNANQGYSVAISQDGNTAVVGAPADNGGIGAAWIFTRSGTTWTQQGNKLVGSNAVGLSSQGFSVAISADGNTVLVGGWTDNNQAGAAWVFTRSGGVWTQQGPKLPGVTAGATAYSVALSGDGNTALLGSPADVTSVGSVFVYTRTGSTWNLQTKLTGSGNSGQAQEGSSVALSYDGNTAAIGGYLDAANHAGATWVFTRSGNTWTQQGNKLVGNDVSGSARQGVSVALSTDGNTLAVGGLLDNNGTGAVWIYTRSGGVWSQQGPKLVGTGASGAAEQGTSVALSADGNTLAEGGFTDNNRAGAAWWFTRSGNTWAQQGAKIVGAGAVNPAWQGLSVALSANADTLIIGGPNDNGGVGAMWPFGPSVVFTATPLGFFPITPCRAVDTRPGQGKSGAFGGPALSGFVQRNFPLAQSGCNLPASSGTTHFAYSLNFTAVPPGPLSFLSAWPSDQPYPGVSTLNSPGGQVIANAAIVAAAPDGAGDVSVVTGESTDLIIDANGYFATPNGQELDFYPLTPCRVVDTRAGQGKSGAFGPPALAGFVQRDFPILQSTCNVPNTAKAYSLNMTVVPPGPLSFLSSWPAGQPYPNVSTLNAPDGSTLANAAIVPAGTNGAITVVAGNTTDFIIDINGYFGPPGSAGALRFYAVAPCRVVDTRPGQGKGGAFGPPALASFVQRDFPLLQGSCNIPATAKAYSLNMTAVPQGSLSFLSTWPAGQPYPNVSTLNSTRGNVIANAAIVPAGTNGAVTVVAGNPTDLIIDINGYFAP